MSYQRFTNGDAYVIAADSGDRVVFECICCNGGNVVEFLTYRDIIEHLKTAHVNSEYGIANLLEEANIAGMDKTFADYEVIRKQFDW